MAVTKVIDEVTWSATGLPSGLTINKDTGVISGTPNVQPPATVTATVTVVTNYGRDSKTLTIKIEPPQSWWPVIDAGQVINVITNEAMTPYTVTGTNVTKTS